MASTVQAGLDSLRDDDTLSVQVGVYEEVLHAPALRFTMIGEIVQDSGQTLLPWIAATLVDTPGTVPIFALPLGSRAQIKNMQFVNQNRKGIVCSSSEISLSNCHVYFAERGFVFNEMELGTVVTIRECTFQGNIDMCVWVRRGNALNAKNCLFTSTGTSVGNSLVSSWNLLVDSCLFSSDNGSALLSSGQGRQFISNCRFGPTNAQASEASSVIELHDGSVRLLNNSFVDCVYESDVLRIQSEWGDSVEICGNRFERCVGGEGFLTAVGCIYLTITGSTDIRGPLICNNEFIECSGNTHCDDLMITTATAARIEGNYFTRDSLNGRPSIRIGDPTWTHIPVTLRNNRWEECGFAASLNPQADARFNYWGHTSGPFHAFVNPSGLGDTILGTSQFIPWLEDSTDATGSFPEAPDQFSLQVYPNPFNATVSIEYALTREQAVKLEIYDVLGRKVETLVDEMKIAGKHNAHWNADEFASGVYFARLSTGNQSISLAVKLLLLK